MDDARVSVKMRRLSKRFVTQVTTVGPRTHVHSAVSIKVTQLRESFAADRTLKRSLSRMTTLVNLQLSTVLTTSATFDAFRLTLVNIHMATQVCLGRETFLAD